MRTVKSCKARVPSRSYSIYKGLAAGKNLEGLAMVARYVVRAGVDVGIGKGQV